MWLPCLAAEISTWTDHPRPAADTTQPEELPGTWADGAMVRMTQTLSTVGSKDHSEICSVCKRHMQLHMQAVIS